MFSLHRVVWYFGVATAASLLGADPAAARDSWFVEACERAARHNHSYIEVQQGTGVVRIDCIGEIIEIHDDGDDGPSVPGGSTGPGGNDPGGGEGGPGGGGGSGSPYEDPCDACKQTANKCRENAHSFRKTCMGAGFRFVSEQCSGWGGDKPRNCDGSLFSDLGEFYSPIQQRDRCLIISFDRKGQPLAKEVCDGSGVQRCINDCMNGTGGGRGGGISIAGTGISGSVNVPATDGVNKSCTQTAATLGTNCGQEEAACRKKHSCDVKPLRGDTSGRNKLAERFGRVLTQTTGDAVLVENLTEAELRRLGAQHWLADYLGEAYLGRVNEQRFLALIGEATDRYLALYHAGQPNKSPTVDGRAPSAGASAAPATALKRPNVATRTTGGAVLSRKTQTTAQTGADTRAPDTGPRFENADSVLKVDDIFLRKAFLFLTPKQEDLLLQSWPGGALVFGSGIVRTR